MGQKPSKIVAATGGGIIALGIILVCANQNVFANRMYMSLEVYDAYCHWKGKPQYYTYKAKGLSMHSGIVVRGSESMPAMLIHLNLMERKWVIRCNKTRWNPPDQGYETAIHEWDLGSTFTVCAKFASEFKYYNVLFRNCRTFRHDLVEKMKQIGHESRNVTTGYWPIEKIVRLSAELNIDFILQLEKRQHEMFKTERPKLSTYLS